jgi:hypothetical protein
MPEMYCPKCGRELELDSGEIRFCRHCGFSLTDTKEALHGYSEHKRIGFSVVTWAYALLLVVALLLHGRYVSLDTGWIYWLISILIVVSVSCFTSAAISALKPGLFSKAKQRKKSSAAHRDSLSARPDLDAQPAPLLPQAKVPVADLLNQRAREVEMKGARSVVEGTTRNLNER